jgi:S-DNA-T family DNA segregation ATPase FtsK/SpoIIIE
MATPWWVTLPQCLIVWSLVPRVCINSIIASILYKFGPDELRFIMIDPKVVEMQVYAKLPHLVVPVVTDPKRVVGALNWCVNEMERRYKIFAKLGVRNFDSFNSRVRPVEEVVTEEEKEDLESIVDEEAIESMARAFEDGDIGPIASEDDEVHEDDLEVPDRFPYIVVIIDELADLMQTAPADVEGAIARIAQKARAAGIHLIVATQTPRADVVTGIIKANIPSRIAFQVSSSLDSRVILDTKGAEKLVGKGDMLFLPPGSAKLERAQGAFVSDEEVEQIVNFCANQSEQKFEESIQKVIENGGANGDGADDVSDADEETIERCIEVLRAEGKASTSLLQRRLRLGYTRAARMIDILEARGMVGPGDGAKPREVLLPGCGSVPGGE